MKSTKIFRVLISLVIVITNISCDQISKNIVRKNIDYNENIELIKNHFFITKIENTGAFLSWGEHLAPMLKGVIFMGLPLLFLFGTLIYILRNTKISRTFSVALCFMIGGGIGNIYDRIRYGSVTDFLYIDLNVFHTGIFNLADVSVMVGVGLLLCSGFQKRFNIN